MSAVTLKTVQNTTRAFMHRALQVEGLFQTWAQRNALPKYKNKQKRRWITENDSEGHRWKELSTPWVEHKIRMRKKNPDAFPGGKKKLVYTGTLFKAVTLQDLTFGRHLATRRQFYVATTLPYAKYVNEARPFSIWSEATVKEFRDEFRDTLQRHLKKLGGRK